VGPDLRGHRGKIRFLSLSSLLGGNRCLTLLQEFNFCTIRQVTAHNSSSPRETDTKAVARGVVLAYSSL